MQTKAKANSVITSEAIKTAEGETTGILFKVKGAGEFPLHFSQVSQAVKTRAMVHGLLQRVSDAGAMSRDTKTGQAPLPQVRFEAMKRIADHYASGAEEWAVPRTEGAGATGARLDAIILAAVCEVTNKTHAEVRAMIESGSGKAKVTPKAYLDALGQSAKVKPVVDRIRGEAPPIIDVDAELDALMMGGEEEPEADEQDDPEA